MFLKRRLVAAPLPLSQEALKQPNGGTRAPVTNDLVLMGGLAIPDPMVIRKTPESCSFDTFISATHPPLSPLFLGVDACPDTGEGQFWVGFRSDFGRFQSFLTKSDQKLTKNRPKVDPVPGVRSECAVYEGWRSVAEIKVSAPQKLGEMKFYNFSHKTWSDKLGGILGEDLRVILYNKWSTKMCRPISPNSSARVIKICRRNFALGKVRHNVAPMVIRKTPESCNSHPTPNNSKTLFSGWQWAGANQAHKLLRPEMLCAPRCGVILATDLAISVCLASV